MRWPLHGGRAAWFNSMCACAICGYHRGPGAVGPGVSTMGGLGFRPCNEQQQQASQDRKQPADSARDLEDWRWRRVVIVRTRAASQYRQEVRSDQPAKPKKTATLDQTDPPTALNRRHLSFLQPPSGHFLGLRRAARTASCHVFTLPSRRTEMLISSLIQSPRSVRASWCPS
ncbi:hypothetical protein ANO11243_077220 [Dothideomycetidae sp. 11243]|nr:hypothetical protein ANO11243_077220 [fungal sp. No.11243]